MAYASIPYRRRRKRCANHRSYRRPFSIKQIALLQWLQHATMVVTKRARGRVTSCARGQRQNEPAPFANSARGGSAEPAAAAGCGSAWSKCVAHRLRWLVASRNHRGQALADGPRGHLGARAERQLAENVLDVPLGRVQRWLLGTAYRERNRTVQIER